MFRNLLQCFFSEFGWSRYLRRNLLLCAIKQLLLQVLCCEWKICGWSYWVENIMKARVLVAHDFKLLAYLLFNTAQSHKSKQHFMSLKHLSSCA